MMSESLPEERLITRAILCGVLTPDVWQSVLFRDMGLEYLDPGPAHLIVVDVRFVPIVRNTAGGGQ